MLHTMFNARLHRKRILKRSRPKHIRYNSQRRERLVESITIISGGMKIADGGVILLNL